ncbi:MAG: helicase, partial [Dermacoccus nishinomiyaensis]
MSSAVTRTDGAGPEQWLDALRDAGTGGVTHVRTRPAREASLAEWPDAVAPAVRAAFEGKGIHHLWSHQRTALDAVFERRHVVVATGTASGKSLAYQVPML